MGNAQGPPSARSDAGFPSTVLGRGADIHFIENLGQLGTEGGALYALGDPLSMAFFEDRVMVVTRGPGGAGAPSGAAYEVRFLGARHVTPQGSDPTGTVYSYLTGNDASRWVSRAAGYGTVVYHGLWDGVDLAYRTEGPRVKYEFTVHPGADPSSIGLGFEGTLGVTLDEKGDLVVRTGAGCVRDESPSSYQCGGDGTSTVESGFVMRGDGTVGFRVGPYDPSRTLVIDPRLIFSSYVGTASDEWVQDCAVDGAGDVYLMGATEGADFPTTTGAVDPTFNGGLDVFLCKLSQNGMKLLHCTYVGGAGNDGGPYTGPSQASDVGGMCIDSEGAVYLTGPTNSSDFPTTAGAYDRTHNGGYDAFVIKLDPGLGSIAYGTYVGGAGDDFPMDIDVDADGSSVVAGTTLGTFPTTIGAFDRVANGAEDAFAFQLDPTGATLLGSTHLGGSGKDFGTALAIDDSGIVYVVGASESGDFPTRSAYDATHNGMRDMFVTRINSTWGGLAYSTFIGTSGQEYANDVRVDFSGRAYVVGYTTSSAFPTTTGCYKKAFAGSIDGVVLRLDAYGSFVDKCTFFGGTSDDRGYGIALDPNGDVLVTGFTLGTTPTTTGAYCSTNEGDMDVFIARLDGTLSTLRYGSMFGGSGEDKAWAVACGARGDVFVAGHTTSLDYPATVGAYDGTFNGGVDGFVLKVGEPMPPRWRAIPALLAVEDVPLAFDFSGNVTDPDTALSGLSITSLSPYVVLTSGLQVTFQFPNGVLTAKVVLELTDLWNRVPGTVNFTVTPVNDAPTCTIPGRLEATEGVPRVIDFAPYVQDADSPRGDLHLDTDSPYAEVDNLTVTLLFPDGVLSHDLWVNVSDGLASTEVHVVIDVHPVDDPPVIATLPTFEVLEDVNSAFNLTPYLSDVDTPIGGLTVSVNDPNITVDGQELIYLSHRGGARFSVAVEVSDGTSRVSALLWVHVAEVNDPPIVLTIPPQLFIEDMPGDMDITSYVLDEDTPRESLIIECQDPSLVSTKGLGMTLLFKHWVPDYTLVFNVSDGSSRAKGSFEVQVMAVNDPPTIMGMGGLVPPFSVVLDEGQDVYYALSISDEDSPRFKYSMVSEWNGISVLQNGTVHIATDKGDVGNHTALLSVDDMNGGATSATIAIRVRNVNDPPSTLFILEPFNHSVVVRGDNVTFSVDVSDPDMAAGQVLMVTWTSNISGPLRTLSSASGLHFKTDALPIGTHLITVNVTDGQFTKEAWFVLTVEPQYTPPSPRPVVSNPFPVLVAIGGVILAVFFLVLITAMIVVMNRRGRAEGEERASAATSEAAPPPEHGTAPITMEGDLRALGASVGDMAAQLEATRAAEARAAAALPAGPAPVLETVAVPVSEAEEADRERTREVREVMRALTQLPQGLPTTLGGWDMAELARAIVDGEKRTTPDGTPLVRIKGKWYNADRANVGAFAREWKEPEPVVVARRSAMTHEERARKLEQLETALLEGKISEQTYRELKRKYEGGG